MTITKTLPLGTISFSDMNDGFDFPTNTPVSLNHVLVRVETGTFPGTPVSFSQARGTIIDHSSFFGSTTPVQGAMGFMSGTPTLPICVGHAGQSLWGGSGTTISRGDLVTTYDQNITKYQISGIFDDVYGGTSNGFILCLFGTLSVTAIKGIEIRGNAFTKNYVTSNASDFTVGNGQSQWRWMGAPFGFTSASFYTALITQ